MHARTGRTENDVMGWDRSDGSRIVRAWYHVLCPSLPGEKMKRSGGLLVVKSRAGNQILTVRWRGLQAVLCVGGLTWTHEVTTAIRNGTLSDYSSNCTAQLLEVSPCPSPNH